MEMTRRDWLGIASAAGATALAEPLLAQAESGGILTPGANDRNYAPVVERLKAFAAQELADKGFPGMSVALAVPDGFSAAFASGFGDLDRRIAATPDQLFQIGSITKSLTALTLFVLADRGRLDLDARVQDLLPEHPLPPEPITLTHLLEHSSGLPNSLGDSLNDSGAASPPVRATHTAILATPIWARSQRRPRACRLRRRYRRWCCGRWA
jgi:CubicO group peptidase (beta-lactamase class C family)